MAIYEFESGQESIEDLRKSINVTDNVVVRTVNVDDLLTRHAELLVGIDSLKDEADAIVDELTAIDEYPDLEITVSGIPSKFQGE